ncbi:uncharacterized protein LOC113209428 [Frankliniella occidentalis]|uniref:Uncharacterized protein LOC113209428 n=1 Tax=Frankliniella occidentalis TaxID=133901 RepID=A0A6J1STR9_FRAOC|nr:uncharacterized protein LOC113209428 [Frankliniella occidentalis]
MDILERDDPPLDAKLAEPIVWGTVAGFTAQELKPDLFDECLKLIKRYLIPEEAMCVALDLRADAEGCASFLANAKECMKDGTSIVVLKGEDYDDDDEGGEGKEDPLDGDGGEQGVSKNKEVVEGCREDGQGELLKKGSDVANVAEEALASANHTANVQEEPRPNLEEKEGNAEGNEEGEDKEKIIEEVKNENEFNMADDEKENGESLIDNAGTRQEPTNNDNEMDNIEEEGIVDDKIKPDKKEVEESEERNNEDEVKEDDDSEEERRKKKRERRKRRHKKRERERARRRKAEEGVTEENEAEGDDNKEEGQKGDGDDEEEEKEDEREEDDDDGDSRVVAVMVARVVQRLEHMRSFSRIKVVQGEAYQKWLALRCHLQKTANLFEEFDVDTYYRLYHIVVHPDHRKKGVGSFLVRLAAQRLAGLFAGPGATVCTAVAPSRATQRLLARQGFRPRVLLNYHEWKDEQGQQVISGAGVGNYNVALTVYEVAPREEGEPPDVSPMLESTEETEEEPGPPTAFPGRALGLDKPPAPECPPAHEEPPFAVAVSASRPPSAPPLDLADAADLDSGAETGETDSSSSSSSGGSSCSVVEGARGGGSGGSGSTEPST